MMHRIGLKHREAVHEDSPVADLDFVSADRDYALHESNLGVARVLKDDDLSALRLFKHRQPPTCEGDARTIEPFVQQKMIADEDGAFHRGSGNHAGLDDESADEERGSG